MFQPLKIAHFTQFLGIGGLEKIILDLSLKQMSLGHQVEVVVYDEQQEWVSFFKEKGILVRSEIKKKKGLDFSLVDQFSDLILHSHYDIIHTHDINPLIYLSLTKKLLQLKYGYPLKHIHTTHTLDHVENSWKVDLLERLFSPCADHLIAVSKKIYDYYLQSVFIASTKLGLIENGVAVDDKAPSEEEMIQLSHELGRDPSKLMAISLSRVVPLKDQEFLIRSMDDFPQIQLFIVGPPSDPIYFKKLEELATKATHSNIIFTGARTDVKALNQLADIYLSASTHEGLPVSVLEAMSVGTPCLVSHIPGHRILNKYGKCIKLYQIKDQKDFKSKLLLLLKENEIKGEKRIPKDLSLKAIVLNHFSIQRMTKNYERIYRQ